MVAMRRAVAHPMPVANGVPLAAIGACEEVPPCCVTVISACACRHVAGPANLRVPLQRIQALRATEHAEHAIEVAQAHFMPAFAG